MISNRIQTPHSSCCDLGVNKNCTSQTPHSSCCDLGGDKTCTSHWSGQSGSRVQVWVQVWGLACHLAISPKAVPGGNQKFRGQNQLPSSWGSSPALLGQVNIWHRNNAACSQSTPMQSSRSKSTTCLRTGHLFSLELNSTAISDGFKQKLGFNVRHDSELIATKVCSQISHKWNAMFESHVVTLKWPALTGRTLIFYLKIFLGNLPL